ncbi:MAG TPA: glycosyltransferase family 39 protein [Kiloniellales bacterium]|nr:glycosyltransferase family 39 protein [Kiloniellales bacterium]
MPSRPALESPWPLRAALLLAATFALRLFLASDVPLAFGESYYLASVRQLDWSWFDQPPLTLWAIGLTQRLFGEDSWLLLRLPQLVFFLLLGWRVYAFTAAAYGGRAGFLALLLLELAAVFGMTAGWLIQPDALFFLLWWLAVEALWRALRLGGWAQWLLAGLLLGLTLLAKYPGVLLGIGAILYLLLSSRDRIWLLRPQPYAAAAVALLLQAPVLLWNWRHGWISFAFQGGRAVDSGGLDWERFLGAILGQAIWVLPWVWLVLLLALARSFRRLADDRDPGRFLALAALPTLLLFTLVALWSPIGRHFHWQAPGYLLLLPLAGRLLDQGLASGRRLARAWLAASVALSAVLLIVLWGHATRGWLTPLLGDDLRREDDTRELVDWRPLAPAVAGTDAAFLVTNRWHQAGKADAAIQGALPVFCFCDDPRNLAFGRDPAAFLGRDAIILQNPEFMKDPEALYGEYFAAIEPLGELHLGRGGREEVTLRLWRGRSLSAPYPMPYGP